jgi:hypothetical protein
LLGEITELAKGDVGNGALQAERGRLATALADVQGIIAAMVGFLGHETGRGVYMIGLHTTTLLFALSELVVGWLLLRQAEVAFTALSRNPGAADRAFYDGKVAAARFFTNTVLPDLSAKRAVVEATDLSLMDLEDAAF